MKFKFVFLSTLVLLFVIAFIVYLGSCLVFILLCSSYGVYSSLSITLLWLVDLPYCACVCACMCMFGVPWFPVLI